MQRCLGFNELRMSSVLMRWKKKNQYLSHFSLHLTLLVCGKRVFTNTIQLRFRNCFRSTLILCALGLSVAGEAQNYLSVPFNSGFIGRIGNNSQNADNIQNFSTLGLSNAYFIQNSSTGVFEIQGNDIAGTVRLVSNSGEVLDIDGVLFGGRIQVRRFCCLDSFPLLPLPKWI